jgi:hypothetical protein
MLRKALYCILVLLLCVFVVVGIDVVRRAMAIRRLETKRVAFRDWRYRITHSEAPYPEDAKFALHELWQRSASTPQSAVLDLVALDESVARDLTTSRVEALFVTHCSGFTPRVAAELCERSSIRELIVQSSDMTDEALNLMWKGLPDLERVNVACAQIGGDGFREIGKARKLTELDLLGEKINDRVMARLREAPALKQLFLGTESITEQSVSSMASMPALSQVTLMHSRGNNTLAASLQQRRPQLTVIVSPPMPPNLPDIPGLPEPPAP